MLRIVLTDGNGIQGLSATFGNVVQTNIVQTAADAAAAAASASSAANSAGDALTSASQAATSATNAATSATQAAASASSAATQASNAATSASGAAGSATAASNSATSASNSATSASTSASNASSSATLAQAWASQATGTVNGTAYNSAYYYAQQASTTLANALVKANNLSDVASPSTSLTNLGGAALTGATFTGNMSSKGGAAVGVANTSVSAWASGSGAFLQLTDSTRTANNRIADFNWNGGALYGRFPTDNYSSAANWLIVTGGNASGISSIALSNRPTFNGNLAWDAGNFNPANYPLTASGPFSGKNRIINGDCRVQQYGSAAFGTGASGFGSVDRFKVANSGSAGGNFSQSASTIAFGGVNKIFVVQTVNTPIASTSSTNYWSGISQNIEGFNCADLLGSQVTVSFLFYTTVSGTYSIVLADGTAANSCVSSFSAVSGVQKVTVTFPTLPTNLGCAFNNSLGLVVAIGFLNTGTYQTSTLNAWQSGIYRTASGAVNWGATANNVIGVSELQLEAGAVATPFERRSYGLELMLCQRYYESGFLRGVIGVAQNYLGATTRYHATKRATPTLAFSDAALNPNKVSINGTNNIAVTTGGPATTTEEFYMDAIVGANYSNWWAINWSASAEI